MKKNRAPKPVSTVGDASPRRLGGLDQPLELGEHVGVDRPRHRGDAGIARRLGPDLDDHARLFRRLARTTCSRKPARTASTMSAPSARSSAKSSARSCLVARAEALDDRFLGREGAVEVAGAHAGRLRDMLHGRGVETVRGEGALGRLQDALAPLARRCGAGVEKELSDMGAFENERSFSVPDDYGVIASRPSCGGLMRRARRPSPGQSRSWSIRAAG